MADKHGQASPIELDGRTLEGGGQLLRNSLCLSALTGTPIRVHSIRGNRSSGGGLKPQHLACVNWLALACNATVQGAEKGSKILDFTPGPASTQLSPAFKKVTTKGQTVYASRLDIGTAGATGLALQAILPFILFSRFPSPHPVHLTLTGGTNVTGSPSYDYIAHVLLPTLHSIGLPHITSTINRRGWSQGGNTSIGEITFHIPPRPSILLSAFDLHLSNLSTPWQPSHLHATILAPSTCHDHFRTVLLPAIHHHFGKQFTPEAGNLTITCEGSLHIKRNYLLLVDTIPSTSNTPSYVLARDHLYTRKTPSPERAATEMSERVTNELANEVESGACVDEFLRDQLVIFQALAEGTSRVYPGADEEGDLREPSLHARTAEWVAKTLVGARLAGSEGTGCGFGREETGELEEQLEALKVDE